MTVHAHPADADTRELPPIAFTGVVLHVSGYYTPIGETAAAAFTIEITTDLEHADIALPTDIILSSSSLTGQIDINIEYNTWFEGIDVTLLDAGDATQLANFRDNITASIKHH